MPVAANFVYETTTGTGTSTLTLTSVTGKQTFNQAFGTGSTTDVFSYFISNRSANEWEVGTGHMSAATTLVRDTIINSSNGNLVVNFTAGTKEVTNDRPANTDLLVGNGFGIVVGHTVHLDTDAHAEVQVLGTATGDASVLIGRFSANAVGPTLAFIKDRSGSIATNGTIVSDNDDLGGLSWFPGDGNAHSWPQNTT